jgi:hypothetical protein
MEESFKTGTVGAIANQAWDSLWICTSGPVMAHVRHVPLRILYSQPSLRFLSTSHSLLFLKRIFGTKEEKSSLKEKDAVKRKQMISEFKEHFADLEEFSKKRGKRHESGPALLSVCSLYNLEPQLLDHLYCRQVLQQPCLVYRESTWNCATRL